MNQPTSHQASLSTSSPTHNHTSTNPASSSPTTGNTLGLAPFEDHHSKSMAGYKLQDDLAYQCLKGQAFMVKTEKL
jgi:hypothetical protein